MTTELPGELVVAPADAKDRWFLVAGCAGMTAVSIALIIFAGLAGFVIGLLGAAFFGAVGLPYLMFRAMRPESPLTVTAEGFNVNRYATDHGFIAWAEVGDVGIATYRTRSFVEVKLADPAAFLRRHRPFRRLLLRTQGKLGLATVRISEAELGVPAADVAAIMSANLRRSRGGAG